MSKDKEIEKISTILPSINQKLSLTTDIVSKLNSFIQETEGKEFIKKYKTNLGNNLENINQYIEYFNNFFIKFLEKQDINEFQIENGSNIINTKILDISKDEKIKELGKGGYGSVLLYKNSTFGQYSVKFIKKEGSDLKHLEREINILKTNRHPNIINYYKHSENEDNHLIYMEYAQNGSLYDFIQNQSQNNFQEFTIKMKYQISLDICKGLLNLHQFPIYHRDLKSQNILITKNFRAKITDFGLSKFVEDNFGKNDNQISEKSTFYNSPYWRAPETFKDYQIYDDKTDIYSFGMICWEIFHGKIPFEGFSGNEYIFKTKIINNERTKIYEK